MTGDDRLIGEVARAWVAGGGDADGIVWCVYRLRDAMQEEIDQLLEESCFLDGLNERHHAEVWK